METTKTLIAYHGDPALKARFVELVRAHQEADRIIQGTYWDGVNGTESGRGCAVGCSINSLRIITGKPLDWQDHSVYEIELGVPEVLARLEDRIFEGLPIEDAKAWPLRFSEAIPVGADLSGVWPRFAVWLLMDEQEGVIRYATTEGTQKAIQDVAALYERVGAGETVPPSEFRNAASAAYAASAASAASAADAASAAYAASYAASAAYAAARTARTASAAYAAARTARTAGAAGAAGEKARRKQADKLVELLAGAPVLVGEEAANV